MKHLVLAAIAAGSLGLAACTTEANRGISPGAQVDTMTPNSSSQVARPIQSGGGASAGFQSGGTMAEVSRGPQTTTVVSPARPDTGGTMNDPAVVRAPR